MDTESGLYNFDARLYDPTLGRFISPDPAVPDLSDPTNPRNFDPQMLNRYAYCRNNPMIYIDPSGLEDEEGLASGKGPMTSEEEDHSEDALVNGGSESRSKDVSDFLFEGLPEEYEDEGRLKLLKSVLEEDRENRNRTTLELDLISFLSDLAFPFCPPVFYAGGQKAAAKNLERTKDAYNIGLAEERDVDICAFTTAFGSLPGPTGAPLSGFQLGYDIGRMNGWW